MNTRSIRTGCRPGFGQAVYAAQQQAQGSESKDESPSASSSSADKKASGDQKGDEPVEGDFEEVKKDDK